MPTLAAAARPIPGISSHEMLVFLLQIGVLIAIAALLGRVATRLGLPAVVGELSAGVVLGPSLFGRVLPGLSGWLLPRTPEQNHLLSATAQIGALALVGVAGAHLDVAALRRRSALIGTVSAASVLLPLSLGVGLGFVLPASLHGAHGGRGTFALFIGVAMAVSALPVIAKTLFDMGLLHRDVGQLIIGAAAVSDVAGWLLLSIVAATATGGGHPSVVFRSAGYLAAVLAFTVLLARPLAKAALRLVRSAERAGDRVGDRDALGDTAGATDSAAARDTAVATERAGAGAGTAILFVLIMLAAAGTQALSLEPILGAFLCGIVIGSLGSRDRALLEPLRGFTMSVLAPLFFASAGLQVDLGTLGDHKVLFAGLAMLAIAVSAKYAGGYAGARLGGVTHREAQAVGAGLNARGAVEIVLATVGLQLGVLTVAAFTLVVMLAVVTSLMAPPLLRRAMREIEVTPLEVAREREFAGAAAG